ncbi:MAG TPA: hypothetical protein VEX39_02070 [Thermoleophilaceae bacterium]|nr:hypothetical protein [Thermoleophilaceae bacterium]
MASIALFVALGGTGYAAATGSIDTREIKNSTIRGKDVKNKSLTGGDVKGNSVTGTQVNEGRLAKVPSAGRADSASSATTANTANTAGNGVKAFGTVNADGTVVAAKSSNITATRETTGVYCVKANGVSSATRTLVATADFRGAGSDHVAMYDSVTGTCTNSGGWTIRTRNVGTTQDLNFSVVIP